MPGAEEVDINKGKEVFTNSRMERKVDEEEMEENRDQVHQLRGQDTGYRGRGDHYQQRWEIKQKQNY